MTPAVDVVNSRRTASPSAGAARAVLRRRVPDGGLGRGPRGDVRLRLYVVERGSGCVWTLNGKQAMLLKAMDILRQNTSNGNTQTWQQTYGFEKEKKENTGGEGAAYAKNPRPPTEAMAVRPCNVRNGRLRSRHAGMPERPPGRHRAGATTSSSDAEGALVGEVALRVRRDEPRRPRGPVGGAERAEHVAAHGADAAGAPSVLEPRRAAARPVQRRPGPLDGIFERAPQRRRRERRDRRRRARSPVRLSQLRRSATRASPAATSARSPATATTTRRSSGASG